MNKNITRTTVMASALITISCLSPTKISSYYSGEPTGRNPVKARMIEVRAIDVYQTLRDQFNRLASLIKDCQITEEILTLAKVIVESIKYLLACFTETILADTENALIGTRAEKFLKIFDQHLVILQNINQQEIQEAPLNVKNQVRTTIEFLDEYRNQWKLYDHDSETPILLTRVNLQSRVNSQYGSLNSDTERQYELKRPRRSKHKCCVLQ